MSYKVYPLTKTELNYDGYEIKINGVDVKPDVARVSAMPFNRRWPGHQRSIDQTELINFLSLCKYILNTGNHLKVHPET